VVEDDCALGDPVAPWNLKDRRAALGSNRIGLDLRWSRLASLSCWPGLQSDFETNVINAPGRCAVSMESPFGAQAMSVSGPYQPNSALVLNVGFEGQTGSDFPLPTPPLLTDVGPSAANLAALHA